MNAVKNIPSGENVNQTVEAINSPKTPSTPDPLVGKDPAGNKSASEREHNLVGDVAAFAPDDAADEVFDRVAHEYQTSWSRN